MSPYGAVVRGCGAVGGKISGHGVEFCLHAANLVFKPRLYPVDLFREHLMAFDYQIKPVLDRIGKGADMAGNHPVNSFKILFVQGSPPWALSLFYPAPYFR
ncbi:MAG: hypothetical protein PHW17_13795 [Desulfobacterales bacterium]|jgi:hypothetical protein|nr:hypothetical protein [Desulfobacterales bacterium]